MNRQRRSALSSFPTQRTAGRSCATIESSAGWQQLCLSWRRPRRPALPRLRWPIMLPERMRARRAPSSGEAGSTTIVATHDPVVAGPNAGTRITTRHVNPTPPAAFALNSAKASTVLLCCCGARVRKSYNREKADGRQITHCICPSVDGLRYLFSANG